MSGFRNNGNLDHCAKGHFIRPDIVLSKDNDKMLKLIRAIVIPSMGRNPYEQIYKLEALRERRPPWPRQIITPILSTAKMLSLGCERLPTPLKKNLKKKKKKKVLDHYLHHDLGMLPLLRCFLLIYSSYNTQITTKI